MLKEASAEDRLTQLRTLRDILAETIDSRPGARDLSQLSKQYRDTVKEIEELESMFAEDEVSRIIAGVE